RGALLAPHHLVDLGLIEAGQVPELVPPQPLDHLRPEQDAEKEAEDDGDGGLERDEGEDAQEAQPVGFEPILTRSDEQKQHELTTKSRRARSTSLPEHRFVLFVTSW